MVDALWEARRVLAPLGVVIDVRPVSAPIILERVIAAQTDWAKPFDLYSAPADVAAADATVRGAVSRGHLVLETSVQFDFEIYCDTADEFRVYVEAHNLRGTDVSYEELEELRTESSPDGQAARLRCRRRWMLSSFRKT